VKSGSSSAVAFGRVLQVARKRLAKNQADVARSFSPPLSIAAVSMAESGNRPPKTESAVRGYGAALELDDDALLELWWAMQGMVEEHADERTVQRWWKQLRPSREAEQDYLWADEAARKVRDPNNEVYAPSRQLFALADEICGILRRLLGDNWTVGYKPKLGLADPVDGHPAAIMIELRARDPEQGDALETAEPMAAFPCPEPLTRPAPPAATTRLKSETFPPDIAWILSSVEAMPARERAAVAGFIHGLREGASLFSEAPQPPTASR
jgi:hypothetical protein